MPHHLERLSATLSDEALRTPLGDGEQTFAEDLAHLLNSEAVTTHSMYLALLVDEPFIENVHSERDWGKLVGYDQYNFSELPAYYTFRRTVLLDVLFSLSDEQWQRVVREKGKKRNESVYWKARALALHEVDHLIDLQEKLSQGK